MSRSSTLGSQQSATLYHRQTDPFKSVKSLTKYERRTYKIHTAAGTVEEEIAFNQTCVVWSQAGLIRVTHRFDLEQEPVRQAFLTAFPGQSAHTHTATTLKGSSKQSNSKDERALVVLLQTNLHVYFLDGPHLVVDLPFQVLHAHPAPRGIILTRSRSQLAPIPATPKVPAPPPNSFFSSQHTLRSSFLQSPSLQRSLGRQAQAISADGASLEALWQNTFGNAVAAQTDDEDVLFTLTDPLSEPGLVTEAQRSPVLRLSGKSRHPISIDFDPLDPAEQIVYVSPHDELDNTEGQAPLILLATVNADRGSLTIWHGWYLHEKSLLELMKKRSEAKAEKARRRSSFLSASAGTGATTPAVRSRDVLRESFAPLPQTGPHTAKKNDDEAALASQLDPEYAHESIQQSTKEVSRRISSIVSRTDAPGVSSVGASFGGTSYRRGQSYGNAVERRSLNLRRSRGSTPGSVLSRSFGIDDEDSMELENDSELDVDESINDTLQLIRASHEAVGAETLLGTLEGGWRRDFVVQRLHSFNIQRPEHSSPSRFTAVTLQQRRKCTKREENLLTFYVHDALGCQLFSCSMLVKQQKLFPWTGSLLYAAVPVIKSCSTEPAGRSITKLSDGGIEALLCDGTDLRYPGSEIVCTIPALNEQPHGSSVVNHTPVERPDQATSARPPARQRIRLRPTSDAIDDILSVCEMVLPHEMASAIRPTWLTMLEALYTRPALLSGTIEVAESVAAAAVVFAQVLGLLDKKSKAALRLSRVAATKPEGRHLVSLALSQSRQQTLLDSKGIWAKLAGDQAQRDRDQALPIAVALADETSTFSEPLGFSQNSLIATKLMLGMHILSEERKLNCCSSDLPSILSAIISQLGLWLNIDAWSSTPGSYYDLGGASSSSWAFITSSAYRHASLEIMEKPIGVCEWLEHSLAYHAIEQYPTLPQITQLGLDSNIPTSFVNAANGCTPRINMLSELLKRTNTLADPPQLIVEAMRACGLTGDILETLPEGVCTPLKEAIAQCERNPPGTWSSDLLRLVGREDLAADKPSPAPLATQTVAHDVHTACLLAEQPSMVTKTREAERNATSQLIFSEDRRLVDATTMLHYSTTQVAECQKQPDWTDTHYFEQQKRVMQFVTIRMIALPVGDGILHFNSQSPLMTEKYHLAGFSSSCIMQPGGNTLTTDRNGLTEDKVNWAYFHAGVAAGLRISSRATGIDTSWLVFNKPTELTNRHAGLLLALGLNGHLRHLAKWLSFKYLTPKHTMTSLGLLLGLAASHIGSMDGLITRMLSVHISCMLPPGAAELNVSPQTQTAGLLGVGLLYHNTQHRRMTETMLHEIETAGIEDPDCGPDSVKDECYRLAAGFALGLINLGQGRDLHGLSGLAIQQRLLRVAIGAKPVNAVHVMDQATAGATMALALVYMKTRDAAIARQIDVPDTEAQFEHIRPDILMLRVLAKHVIMWDTIVAPSSLSDRTEDAQWVSSNLPKCYRVKWSQLKTSKVGLSSSDLPFYYIVTGLAFAMSLKYAGSGHIGARNEILAVLDRLWALQKKRADSQHYYDTKVARSATRRCIDVLALAAATVMSGTGDLVTFRYLRRLHGRTDAETPYGSHLASHMAIGILFMGGGTCTFGTSNLAISALMVALYPLFPVDVHDNKVHLQAFRHLWVFAVEQRCLVVEDVDLGRAIRMPITVTMRDGSIQSLQSPCILPDLGSITSISTADAAYWQVILDFKANPAHLLKFRAQQRLLVRRCPASEAYDSSFWATVAALTVMPQAVQSISICDWTWALSAFQQLARADIELVSRSGDRSAASDRGTKIDDQLVLRSSAAGQDLDRLWDVRVLLAWAKRLTSSERASSRWLGSQVLAVIEHDIDERRRRVAQR